MADNANPSPIEQRIVLRIQEVIEEGQNAVKHLKQVEQRVRSTEKHLKSLYKQWQRVEKAMRQSRAELLRHLKMDKKSIAMQTAQQKAFEKSAKQAKKLREEYKRLSKAQKSVSPSGGGGSGAGGAGGGGGGGGGFGIGLPAFLSVAAITAATKALASYTTQLARTRDLAAAMTGGRRLGLNRRDSELVTGFASQRFSNRYLSKTELAGLQAIRDRMQKALGEETGKDLTLKLTEGFQSSAEQARFLATASEDVVKALEQFQSVSNIEDFSLAISAATMKTDALSRTAFTLEQAWRDVQDSFESFVQGFVESNEIDLKTVIQDTAQGIVDVINWGRRLAAEFKPVFDFIIAGFKQIEKAADFWKDPLRGGQKAGLSSDIRHQMEMYGATANKYLDIAEEARAQGDTKRTKEAERRAIEAIRKADETYRKGLGILNGPQIEDLTLGVAENVEKVTVETGKAAEQAERQRRAFEGTRSAAEKTALALERSNEAMKLESTRLDLIRSRLARYESSPLGFAAAYSERIRAAEQLNQLLAINQQQQEAVSKLNMDLVENQERMLRLQIEENNILAERNRLLQQQARGYLDAIQAQAFGAGRFHKIIADQNTNLAHALRTGIAKANPLLGLVGDDAARNRVDPFRFTGDPRKDAAALDRRAEQLRRMFPADYGRGNIVPPVPREIIEMRTARVAGSNPHRIIKAKSGANASNAVAQLKEMLMLDRHRLRMTERLIDLIADGIDDSTPQTFRPTRPGGRTALGSS